MAWQQSVTSETDPLKKYIVSFKDGIFSCTCMAWKKQCAPINLRTCKHLIKILGPEIEKKRAPESFAGLTSSFPCHNTKNSELWSNREKPMLFHRWSPKKPSETLTSWYYSIKMNGAFARWQNGKLYTKNGRLLHPPVSITDPLPREVTLEGEIYAGHNKMSKVRKALNNIWDKDVKFIVFDIVEIKVPFEDRWEHLQKLQKKYGFELVPQHVFQSPQDFHRVLEKISQSREEGLVMRHPNSFYEPGVRSKNTLKWKPEKKGQGIIQSITEKKTGYTTKILEDKTDITFTLYITKKHMKINPKKVGDKINFVYFGRDEKDQPEFPQIN
jgi:DNA ligase-1